MFQSTEDGVKINELNTLLQLDDPNKCIIQYIAVGFITNRAFPGSQGSHCLLMEHCSGMLLRDFIKDNHKHCSPKVIVGYTAQLVSGLHYLHNRRPTKLVHGDIKSAHIMMKDSTGEVLKIIDIDCAFQWKDGQRSPEKDKKAMGTLTFMSPEMIAWIYFKEAQQLAPDFSTDIWGLGCVVLDMYRASQGQHLWQEDLMEEAFTRAVYAGQPLTPTIPENMPDELKVLASQCLKLIPSDRPTASTLLKYSDRVYFKCGDSGIHYYIRPPREQLGQRKSGGFGYVQQVNAFWIGANFQDEGQRRLALKTFKDPLDEDEVVKIQTLPELKHDNIVKYLTTGFFDQYPRYRLIMEWCSGGTLKEAAAAETALPVETQKNYVNQLICGIYYLHMEVDPPIVHKDLKGINVVFSDEIKTTLKICDVDSCSVSRKVEQQSVISRVRFTPGFASPELLECENMFHVKGLFPVGRATDIWSLGAVVLEMYCRGNLPDIPSFQRDDILTTTAVADANVEVPLIGEELLALAKKCLVNKPRHRPSIEKLRDDFSKGFSTPSSSAFRERGLDSN
ncbi:putative Mitogen-activated protein kinase kinase kinase 1 [Hypsibius exemplaris]|uniref:non-specific serine/threonine protein kinase n=1 Tax=Hypsibius exemplaris TaxID=2072580 RepID=A0A9X6RKI0_HYPEX|nr:putative Mitogen-activated protein kinase kinase kinase 1 [Hypsibius exemplaris]